MNENGISHCGSAEARVMLRPIVAYRELAQEPGQTGWCVALRRPLFLAILLGSALALSSSGHLSLLLILSCALSWSLVPALQIVSVLAILYLFDHPRITRSRAVDLYFMGQAPWSLWLLGIAGLSTLVSPIELHGWAFESQLPILVSLLTPWLWSQLITLGFFRGALQMSVRKAIAALLLNAVILWGAVALFFLATDQLWQRLAKVAL
jgi:hypothetical protein